MRAAGEATAFEMADGAKVSYARLIDDVARSAAALKSLGVKAGDRVMAQVEKSLPNVCLYLATLKIGAVYNRSTRPTCRRSSSISSATPSPR
jgi:acyl-coenzyme A synthetase/AMP-(fatty) acid ligase